MCFFTPFPSPQRNGSSGCKRCLHGTPCWGLWGAGCSHGSSTILIRLMWVEVCHRLAFARPARAQVSRPRSLRRSEKRACDGTRITLSIYRRGHTGSLMLVWDTYSPDAHERRFTGSSCLGPPSSYSSENLTHHPQPSNSRADGQERTWTLQTCRAMRAYSSLSERTRFQ